MILLPWSQNYVQIVPKVIREEEGELFCLSFPQSLQIVARGIKNNKTVAELTLILKALKTYISQVLCIYKVMLARLTGFCRRTVLHGVGWLVKLVSQTVCNTARSRYVLYEVQ